MWRGGKGIQCWLNIWFGSFICWALFLIFLPCQCPVVLVRGEDLVLDALLCKGGNWRWSLCQI